MDRRIVDFDLDEENHWRAILDCGHRQHVRHDPPLITRPWVLTPEGRATRIGQMLNCLHCDADAGQSADPSLETPRNPAV